MEILSRVIALILLVALAPLFFIISILSFIFQGPPIYFKQARVGFEFKEFILYKFRTMHNLEGHAITYADDSRITLWGRFLRALKLDEIPQLINIFKGDMRFIGPRPEIPKYVNQDEFKFLNQVPPGLSDYASILLRNESKILGNIGGDNPYETLLPLKIDLANYYAERKGFWQDFRLVWLTLMAIIMPNFTCSKFIIPLIKSKLPKWNGFIMEHFVSQ